MNDLEYIALTAGIVGGIVGGAMVAVLLPVFDAWLREKLGHTKEDE